MKTLAVFGLLTLPMTLFAQQQLNLLIGTYTNTGKSQGIYAYTFDAATGQATPKNSVAADNPSFLALSADRLYVYAANENGGGQGAVSAYRYDEASGTLTLVNQQLTQGDHPCHVATDRQGTHVIVSNYSGGSISVFPIQADGRLGKLKQLVQHKGSGPDPDRQQGPHVHSAFFSPDEKQVYVQDLGTDKIQVYDYRPESPDKPLVPAGQPFVKGTPGGGPRHVALSADGRFIYLVEEMAGQIRVFQQQNGIWEAIQEADINARDFSGEDGAADVKLSPDGRFLYASNRGDANTIAIYAVDSDTGKLTKVSNQSVLGVGPRNLVISPDGRHLLVANQQSDEVVIFARDAATGLLNDTGHRIAVGAPVCLVF
ncbi:6-phosphogluconolactonase [Parapedobacter composti]|uniref:6-phosphogluconolactonase n=1 Tax=Parapedobacter composti TaxID=623281 RepID=A0A1I1EZI4_9SPHI|nr:lactonase family protein [Parapedobacter composti]SFB92421.1 6-phosphogluconolactonase [Parapedobacter composti]